MVGGEASEELGFSRHEKWLSRFFGDVLVFGLHGKIGFVNCETRIC